MTDTSPAAAASPLATFFPGYFAFVMATGIIAVGCHLLGAPALGELLYALAALGYVAIAVITVARLVRYPALFAADLASHDKGFAFTTAVAATEVLGAASAVLFGWWAVALVLWCVGLVLWGVLVYTPLIAVVLRAEKPDFGRGINGTWFLLGVSTESIAVLGGLLAPRTGNRALAFLALAFFALGVVLYLMVVTMVFARWAFAPLSRPNEEPASWIAAGAAAITALAGATLLLARGADPLLGQAVPAVELVTVLAWAVAMFWFPVVIALGVRRHIVHRMPLTYHPSYWALVFPIGMFAVATAQTRAATQVDLLGWLDGPVLVLALLAWAVTIVGLVRQLVRSLVRR